MIPYDSDPEFVEKSGKNGDAMTDFDSLHDQVMRELIKFVYKGNQLMYLMGKDSFRLLFMSQLAK